MSRAVALIVAAGRGERLGLDVPKAFAPLAGRPMVEWSVAALLAAPSVDRVVVGGRPLLEWSLDALRAVPSIDRAALSASIDHSSMGRPASGANAFGTSSPRRSPRPAATISPTATRGSRPCPRPTR